MGLIRFFLLIIIFYFVFKFVLRLIMGFSRSRSFFARSDNQYSNRKRDGEITVNLDSSSREKKISKEEGEYIKFEEIKIKEEK